MKTRWKPNPRSPDKTYWCYVNSATRPDSQMEAVCRGLWSYIAAKREQRAHMNAIPRSNGAQMV